MPALAAWAAALMLAPAQAGAAQGDPDADQATIAAWAKDAVELKGWRIVGYGRLGAVLMPDDLEPKGPSFSTSVRYEDMQPGRSPEGEVYRSMQADIDVDCRQRVSTSRRIRVYARNNLGELKTDRAFSARWRDFEPDSMVDRVLMQVCGRAPAVDEGPSTAEEPLVRAWARRIVRPGDDVYVYYDDQGVYYVRGGFIRSPERTYGVSLRLEYFEPDLGMRSVTTRLDMDCDGRRYRMSDIRRYPGHNLSGEPGPPEDPIDWMGPTDGFDALQLDRLCAMATKVSR